MLSIRPLSLLIQAGKFISLAGVAVIWWGAPCLGFSLSFDKRQSASHVVERIIAGDYRSAIFLCDSIIKKDPEEPMGWMLRCSAIGLHDLDLDSVTDSLDFYGVYKKTGGVLFNYENKFGVSSYSCTVKGFAKAIAAAYDLWRKKYFSGLDLGFDALRVLAEAKKLDNTNADADFFLGFYSYARAELKQNFWWAFFWYSGDKAAGIRSLAACSRNAQFINLAAKLLLAEIYYKEKEFAASALITDSLVLIYPASRLVRWTCAKRSEASGANAASAAVYCSLADAYDGIPRARKNALLTRNKAAQMFYSAGDTEKALEACDKVLKAKKQVCDSFCRQICGEAERLRVKITRKYKEKGSE
jgi:hypothetical protein